MLVICPECKNEVLDLAGVCPNCGCSLTTAVQVEAEAKREPCEEPAFVATSEAVNPAFVTAAGNENPALDAAIEGIVAEEPQEAEASTVTDMPATDMPAGDVPATDMSTGDVPATDMSTGDVAAEATQAQEKPKKKKSKTAKTLIAVAIIALLAVGAYLTVTEFIPGYNYNNGVTAMETGEYESASKYFTEAGDYKNADKLYKECKYNQGLSSIESANYEEAANYFAEADDYEDASVYKTCMELAVLVYGDESEEECTELLSDLLDATQTDDNISEECHNVALFVTGDCALYFGKYSSAQNFFELLPSDYTFHGATALERAAVAAVSGKWTATTILKNGKIASLTPPDITTVCYPNGKVVTSGSESNYTDTWQFIDYSNSKFADGLYRYYFGDTVANVLPSDSSGSMMLLTLNSGITIGFSRK